MVTPWLPVVMLFAAIDLEKNAKGFDYFANRLRKVAVEFKAKLLFNIADKEDFSYQLEDYGTEWRVGFVSSSFCSRMLLKNDLDIVFIENIKNDFHLVLGLELEEKKDVGVGAKVTVTMSQKHTVSVIPVAVWL